MLITTRVGIRLHAATAGTGRTVSLSLKDRSAVLMAGKTAAAVYCLDSRDGLFHTSAYYGDSVHSWVAEFNASKRVHSWHGREWTRLRVDLDYDALAGRDDAPGEGYGFAQKRVFPHSMGDEPQPGPRYYGAVDIDALRAGRDAGTIMQEIVQHLTALPRASVRLTLDIAADLPEGVPEHVERTVSENAKALKFRASEFTAE